MTLNVGGADRVLRVIAGIAIIGAGIYYGSWWGVIGVVPVLTGVISWCPAYVPFGWSTRKTETSTEQ